MDVAPNICTEVTLVKTRGVRTEPSNMSNREKSVGIVGMGEKWLQGKNSENNQ